MSLNPPSKISSLVCMGRHANFPRIDAKPDFLTFQRGAGNFEPHFFGTAVQFATGATQSMHYYSSHSRLTVARGCGRLGPLDYAISKAQATNLEIFKKRDRTAMSETGENQ